MKSYLCSRKPPQKVKPRFCPALQQFGTCYIDTKKCDATRYVPYAVAVRHARAEERKAYALGKSRLSKKIIAHDGWSAIADASYEEAQQAQQREVE